MNWQSIKHKDGSVDQYAVQSTCGQYTVCKVSVAGKVSYEAWAGQMRIGSRDTAEEAKLAAERFEQVGPG